MKKKLIELGEIIKENLKDSIFRGLMFMRCFKYKILDGNNVLILTNWIRRETKEEAYNDLREDYPNSTIKLTEVYPSSAWSC